MSVNNLRKNSLAQKIQQQLAAGQSNDATDTWGTLEDVITARSNDVDFYNFMLDYANDPVVGSETDGSKRSLGFSEYSSYFSTKSSTAANLPNLMNGPIKQKLKIIPDNVSWGGQSGVVFSAMGGDFMNPRIVEVDELLAKGASGKQGNEEIGATKDDLRVLVSEAVKGEMCVVVAELKRVFKDGSPLTRASGFTSHSVHQEINLNTNLDGVFSTIPPVVPSADSPPVVLLNHQKKELEKGYVVTNATSRICHGKEVGVGEKKIYITEVIEPDARVYFSSDPNDTFAAYASGGYVVWVDSWIRYI